MNEAILSAVEEHALTPEAIEQVILLSERADVRDQQSLWSESVRTWRPGLLG